MDPNNKFVLILITIMFLLGPASGLEVEITTSHSSYTVADNIGIYVKILDNSTPQNNTLVNFTTTLGNLSATSKYTNSSGIATVNINSTISGNAFVQATTGTDCNTTNITFIADSPTSISINPDQDPLIVGNYSQVHIIPYDQYLNVNNTVNMSLNIRIYDIIGETLYQCNLTRAPYTYTHITINQAGVTITDSSHNTSSILFIINSTIARNVYLNATTSSITNTSIITFTPAAPYSLTTLYDDEYTVNTSSELTVWVYDRYENPISNLTVLFNATPPYNTTYNSPVEYNSLTLAPTSNCTDPDGKSFTIFTTDKRSGDNTINISVSNTSVNASITIKGTPDNCDKLFLSHTPKSAYANNEDQYLISARVVDQFLNPVLPGGGAIDKKVIFSGISESRTVPINFQGVATLQTEPTPFLETLTITAEYDDGSGPTNITNTTNINYIAGNLDHFDIYANPTTVLSYELTGNHNSSITVVALDQWGHTLPDIEVILNNTNPLMGDLSVTGMNMTNYIVTNTSSNGKIYASFISRSVPGNATITATANSINYSVNNSVIINIQNEPFLSVSITAEPEIINSGDIINITTIISVEGELPVSRPAASAILVLDRSGSMDPDYYAGTPLDVVLVLDRSGSMRYLGSSPQQPMTDAKTAAKVFTDNLVSNSQVGVVAFEWTSDIRLGLTLLNSSDNKTLIRNTINDIITAGYTAIGDGMADGNTLLKDGRTDARKIMILLTDGKCTAGNDMDCTDAIADAIANSITVYTIGLGGSENIDESLLQRIAFETGGKYFNAPSSSQLRTVYNSIAQDICDYDITQIEYGDEGFTPFDYAVNGRFTQRDITSIYTIKFDAYDIDTGDECYIKINGNLLNYVPVTGDNIWKSYEYDVSHLVINGTNIISFYDPKNWNNAIRNVEILANNKLLTSYPTSVDLVVDPPYNCTFTTYEYEDYFLINETINDLKVLLEWYNNSVYLNLTLISPTGHVYGQTSDSTGYYYDDREAVPIDVRSNDLDTYIISRIPDTAFTDETFIYITNDLNNANDQASSIMRWKLPDAPTHNAKIESVIMYLRGSGEPNPGWDADSDSRSINIFDLITNYNEPTWNSRNSTSTWASGSFSNADYNRTYLIDSINLSSSIENTIVEFDITNATWDSDRVPDWGEECNIVLTGNNYDGTDANPSIDSFTSSEYYYYNGLNNHRPLVTVTYSIPKDTSEYIWINPLSYTYPDTDNDTVENGNWTVQVSGAMDGSEQFNITTYIDKKSAAQLASYAFVSSFNETRGDKTGLILYSNDNFSTDDCQTSYLRGGNTWVGYFTVNTEAIYYFNLSWADLSDLNISLYQGTTLLDSSTGNSSPEIVSSPLCTDMDYHIIVSKNSNIQNDTQFTVNVSSSPLRTAISAYYDSSGSGGVPRYRTWDGLQWSDEKSANFVGGNIRGIVMQLCPSRDEIIMGTLDDQKDLNIQIWDGSVWGAVEEFSPIANYNNHRGFDIAYEQNSHDAIVVYRNSYTSTCTPRYRVWDGSTWGPESSVDTTDTGSAYIQWVRLAAKPNSDEIILVFMNSDDRLYAQVWDGSAWSNTKVLSTDTATYDYQCFDVVYEQNTGNAVVAWSDKTTGTVRSCAWNGAVWSADSAIYTYSHGVYWIKLASDPNSNNILMGALDSAYDISVSTWNGSTWTLADQLIEDASHGYNRRYFDVEFEQTSGTGIVTWSDNTPTPGYKLWNVSDNSWSLEYSASSVGSSYVSWVKLIPDPYSDNIFLMISDGANDISTQLYSESTWSNPTIFEINSNREYGNYDLVYKKQNISNIRTPVTWTEWYADVTSTLCNDSIEHLCNSIKTITADGLTAIDEGIFKANNEFATIPGNSTMVLMTDGIDNAGYHSILLEVERAKNNNTIIYTIGLGSDESEVDPVLSEIANTTGGKYYFAPDAGTLKDIFRGIAANITNFTADGPELSLIIPHNYLSGTSIATATYIGNSSNSTKDTASNFVVPTYPGNGNAEPNVTTVGNETKLFWKMPNLEPTEKWGVWFKIRMQGAGYVPLILDNSNVTYNDVNDTNITVNISDMDGPSINGSAADIEFIALGTLYLSVNHPTVLIGDPSELSIELRYQDGNPAAAHVTFDTNHGYFGDNKENPYTVCVSFKDEINYASATAGQAYINIIASNGNNSGVDNNTMIIVRPKGLITIS
ncbi:MAG: VWA domain-containing protein [Methanosarcinales archaeon]|nr:VWA domain-containing protein [Methanosarcinales archaeon]